MSAKHDLRPYPHYRESGLPWLGQVPEHWDVRRNGRLFAQRNETGFGDLPILEVSLKTGVRIRDFENSKRKQVMSNRDKYKRAAKGDIAYNMMRMWQGAVGAAPVDGLVSPAYVVARPFHEVDSRYYAYLFRTAAYMNEVNKYSRGIVTDRNRLYWDEFKQMPSPFPPTEEQRVIATFLDHHGQLVRRLIRNRMSLIEVLNEQKEAIVCRTITGGVDGSARCQSLGSHGLVSLRHLATKFGSGVTPRGGASVYKEVGVPFLRSQNIHFDGLRLNGVARISSDLHNELAGTHIRPGDVLLNITGASIGRVCAVPMSFVEGNVNQHVCIIRPRPDRLVAEYLSAYLSTPFMQREIYVEQNGASREGLALDSIKAFKIAVPDLGEQQRIVQAIGLLTARLVRTCRNAEREIALIQEHRTRLISDVVTGKVDVRQLAPAILESTAEDAEPWEEEEAMIDGQEADDLELVEEAADGDN